MPSEGGQPPRRLNRPLFNPFGTNFPSSFQITPDGRQVLYIASQDAEGVFELYASFLTPPHQRASEPTTEAIALTR